MNAKSESGSGSKTASNQPASNQPASNQPASNQPASNQSAGRLSICVFCGARTGNDPKFTRLAGEVGEVMARRGHQLVYGGGNVGLMGALANGALAAGGRVVGIIPNKLLERELAHRGIQQMEVVPDMATRKDRMIEISDAFLSLPGGLGTLDEMFEVLTLRQIGYHQKPSALLDQDGYFSTLVSALSEFAGHGLIDRRELDRLLIARTANEALDQLEAASAAPR